MTAGSVQGGLTVGVARQVQATVKVLRVGVQVRHRSVFGGPGWWGDGRERPGQVDRRCGEAGVVAVKTLEGGV
ncbi:hypothetical protein Airi01_015970 [Actinoallomurus iriomotensis]|uniref:Uncharacterized protein n=1 Tax=Actinoallomurus iriomotensis TaxID=478107 RepID=A0A9W6RG69_9ACTN|nr:hypothetical protein Airi01_015970 [Actinoallomurus iriomotensis]